MPRDQFFYGVKAEMRNSIRHLYDSEKVTFVELLLKARVNEDEEMLAKGRDETASIKSRHLSIISKISKVLQKYHTPDPIARLIGPANETKVQIEGKPFLALIDSGA